MKKKGEISKHIVVKARGGLKPTQVHKVKTKYTRKIKHKKKLTNEQGDNYDKISKEES